MKLSTECVPCLLRRVVYEVELCAPEKAMEALRECSKITSEYACADISSAEFATEIHRCAYGIIGEEDPYEDLKRRSNEIAEGLMPAAKRYVKASNKPLQAAMKISIIGNLLDFGIAGSLGSPDALRKDFNRLLREKLGCDDSAKIEGLLRKTKEVFFLADNCGEIVFDRLLLEQLRDKGKRIVLVIKGEPILTDVTRKELDSVGVMPLVDEVIETEGIAIGLDLWSDNNEVLIERLKRSELIISKGMANFEGLSEFRWPAVAYMLRVKCDPVARDIGVGKDTSAIRLVMNEKG